jgi:hypothetical protein
MKTSQIIACFFAAFGVYLVTTSLVSAVAAVVVINEFSHFSGENMWLLSAVQVAVPFLSILTGLILIFGSRRFGRYAARAATGDDTVFESSLSLQDVTRVLLIAVGAFVIVTSVPRVAQAAFLIFQAKAGGHEIASQAAQRIPDLSELIAVSLTLVLGGVLCLHSRSIAIRILRA